MAKNSGVTAIVAEFKELEESQSERNNSYDEVLQFYSGTTYTEAKKQGFLSGVSENMSAMFSVPRG